MGALDHWEIRVTLPENARWGRCLVVVRADELERWLFRHRSEIAALALAQRLLAGRHDDIGWATDLVAGYLKRNWISYDKDDPDCQHHVRVAAWDYVLGPIANRVL
jgi:hypothetical protein